MGSSYDSEMWSILVSVEYFFLYTSVECAENIYRVIFVLLLFD